jgi:hypothetical protein
VTVLHNGQNGALLINKSANNILNVLKTIEALVCRELVITSAFTHRKYSCKEALVISSVFLKARQKHCFIVIARKFSKPTKPLRESKRSTALLRTKSKESFKAFVTLQKLKAQSALAL